MNQLGFPLLSLVLWLPTIGALLLLLVPRDNLETQRSLALGITLVTFVASLPLYVLFDSSQRAFQFTDSIPWINTLGISYTISVDGVSLWFVLLTTFLAPLTLLASWNPLQPHFRIFLLLLLLLESGLIGVFVAQDMFLFYIFYEFTLIPTALLIGIWGGPERMRAATKAFLYPFAASLFMLLGIIALYLIHGQQTGTYTFDIARLLASRDLDAAAQAGRTTLQFDQATERLLFGAFFIAFAVKLPLWPFHTWLPLAHEQTPAGGAVDVLGLLMKVAGYGLIRFNLQLFPEAARWAAPAIGVLAVISIIYGAIVAYAQNDLKRLLAFSTVSHMGFAVLGLFALNQQGISGAILQMINSGLATGALFLIVGMIYARRGTQAISELSGLWKAVPILGSLTLVMVLASIGLPGLNGFVSEYTVMQGAWISSALGWRFVAAAVIGVILAAVYLLSMYRYAFMGDITPGSATPADLTSREVLVLAVLLVAILAIGLYPNLTFQPMQPSVEQIAQRLAGLFAAAR